MQYFEYFNMDMLLDYIGINTKLAGAFSHHRHEIDYYTSIQGRFFNFFLESFSVHDIRLGTLEFFQGHDVK